VIEGTGQSVALNTTGIDTASGPVSVTIDLTVNDGKGGTGTNKTTISVTPVPTVAPPPTPPPTTTTPTPREQAAQAIRLAEQLVAQRQYDQALRAVQQGLRADPGNQTLRTMQTQIQRAIDVLRQPSPQARAQAELQTAEQLAAQRQYDQAIAAANRGLQLDPNNEALKAAKARYERAKQVLGR
jgi:tetratricopeptide (TPR) repeat protein